MDILVALWTEASEIIKAIIANLPAIGFVAVLAIAHRLSKG